MITFCLKDYVLFGSTDYSLSVLNSQVISSGVTSNVKLISRKLRLIVLKYLMDWNCLILATHFIAGHRLPALNLKSPFINVNIWLSVWETPAPATVKPCQKNKSIYIKNSTISTIPHFCCIRFNLWAKLVMFRIICIRGSGSEWIMCRLLALNRTSARRWSREEWAYGTQPWMRRNLFKMPTFSVMYKGAVMISR